MKLNEFIGARYRCKFPAKLNKAVVDYYRNYSRGTQCLFFLEKMERQNNWELHPDDVRFMIEVAPVVFFELFEAYLYAAYEDVRKNPHRPKGIVIVLDEEENHMYC